MQTVWNGLGMMPLNMVWSEVFVPVSLWVSLHDLPGIPLRVRLPATTHGVLLWSPQEQIWYALDEDPGPIPDPATGTVLESSAFRPGAVLQPGQWQCFALPDDSLPHELHLVSTASSPLALLTALTEIT